jgi:hypothetical protein
MTNPLLLAIWTVNCHFSGERFDPVTTEASYLAGKIDKKVTGIGNPQSRALMD